jgi:hypothetical protein
VSCPQREQSEFFIVLLPTTRCSRGANGELKTIRLSCLQTRVQPLPSLPRLGYSHLAPPYHDREACALHDPTGRGPAVAGAHNPKVSLSKLVETFKVVRVRDQQHLAHSGEASGTGGTDKPSTGHSPTSPSGDSFSCFVMRTS